MALDLHRIRYFLAVAEELHFGRAARRLSMTQPPLTQQIQRLERDLGAQLFDRSKRRIQLTGAGERLLVESRKLLAQLDRTVDSVQRTARGELGRVTIAYVSSAPYEVLPAIIRAFGRAFPEIGLNLVAMTTSAQVEALNNAEIDIGILRPPIENHAGLVLRIIGSEPLIAAISANHTLADNPSLCLAALANQEFVILPRQQGPGYHDLLLSACRAAGFNPKIVHQASQLPELVGFVAGGLGVALLPSTARHIRLPEVAYRDIEPPSVRLQMAAVWRQELISPQLARLLEVLVEVKPIVDLPSYAADDQVLPNHMVF